MTHFVNLRAGPWGSVCSPYILSGDAMAATPMMTSVPWTSVPPLVNGKDVLLAAHGFNVSYESGLRSLQRMEALLAPTDSEAFFGVLWPGDWAIPAINYPAEDKIASHAGAFLGDFCNRWLATARSISFASHSLGARVILEAIKGSARRVRGACITAGAVNSGCLHEEYQGAAQNCDHIGALSSREDLVLKLAFPPGDFAADILYHDHPFFEPAFGRGGPAPPYAPTVRPYEIPDAPPYDHGNYFPPGAWPTPADPAAGTADYRNAVRFVADCFRGRSPAWP